MLCCCRCGPLTRVWARLWSRRRLRCCGCAALILKLELYWLKNKWILCGEQWINEWHYSQLSLCTRVLILYLGPGIVGVIFNIGVFFSSSYFPKSDINLTKKKTAIKYCENYNNYDLTFSTTFHIYSFPYTVVADTHWPVVRFNVWPRHVNS